MAIHKAKVIGTCAVNGTAPGGVTELDDEVINVAALVDGEHIKLLPPEPKPKSKNTKKGDD